MFLSKKVPVTLQMEASECGATSLKMVLEYYKRWIPLEQMRIDCNVTRDGGTAKYIILAARKHGLKADGYKIMPEAIRKRKDFPMIIHWEFCHFVVLCGFDKSGNAIINDPAIGRIKVPFEDFKKSYTGIAIVATPGENFEKTDNNRGFFDFVFLKLKKLYLPLIIVLMASVIYSLCAIVPANIYRIFADLYLEINDNSWISLVINMLIALSLIALVFGFFKQLFLERLKATFQIKMTTEFMWKLLRLPVKFFSQRYDGDIVERIKANDEMAEKLFMNLLPSVVDCTILLLSSIVMIAIDWRMGLVVCSLSILEIFVITILMSKNGDVAKRVGVQHGKVSGVMMSSLYIMETVKAGGAERTLMQNVLGHQANYNNERLQLLKNRVRYGFIPKLFEGTINTAVLIVGVLSIFNGDSSAGILLAFQSLSTMFMGLLGKFAESINLCNELNVTADRIQDIMNFEDDYTEEELFGSDDIKVEELTGEVSIENVSFSYSAVAQPLIKDFSLKVKPGEMIAITGNSGCGKSTLSKLLVRLYKTNQGRILFDNVDINDIDHYVLTSNVSIVDQDISLFKGSIMDNITMWNDEISDADVFQACKDACIHNEILSRPDGYDSLVSEGGSNLSGGQCQRIEIARAFAKNPKIMIFDEATSALDALTEEKIMEALKQRNITCFVVAHRLSTIRDADRIIVLKDGEIAENGTHDELYELKGEYYSLVNAQQ